MLISLCSGLTFFAFVMRIIFNYEKKLNLLLLPKAKQSTDSDQPPEIKLKENILSLLFKKLRFRF